MRISDWSSDVCSSDLVPASGEPAAAREARQLNEPDNRRGEQAGLPERKCREQSGKGHPEGLEKRTDELAGVARLPLPCSCLLPNLRIVKAAADRAPPPFARPVHDRVLDRHRTVTHANTPPSPPHPTPTFCPPARPT